jgi:hypothetical protein
VAQVKSWYLRCNAGKGLVSGMWLTYKVGIQGLVQVNGLYAGCGFRIKLISKGGACIKLVSRGGACMY